MNRLTLWILRRIARSVVEQDWDHHKRIVLYYTVLTKAARSEFREDNKATLDGFLSECHQEALKA